MFSFRLDSVFKCLKFEPSLYLEHVGFDDFLFNGRDEFFHSSQPFFSRRIEAVFLRLKHGSLHHSFVTGPVVTEVGMVLNQFVQSDKPGQKLAQLFEHNL